MFVSDVIQFVTNVTRHDFNVIHQSRNVLEDLMVDPLKHIVRIIIRGCGDQVGVVYMPRTDCGNGRGGSFNAEIIDYCRQFFHHRLRRLHRLYSAKIEI